MKEEYSVVHLLQPAPSESILVAEDVFYVSFLPHVAIDSADTATTNQLIREVKDLTQMFASFPMKMIGLEMADSYQRQPVMIFEQEQAHKLHVELLMLAMWSGIPLTDITNVGSSFRPLISFSGRTETVQEVNVDGLTIVKHHQGLGENFMEVLATFGMSTFDEMTEDIFS
jgi:hypothetical protein